MMLRLPENVGKRVRTQAFKDTVNYMSGDMGNSGAGATSTGKSSGEREMGGQPSVRKALLQIEQAYPWIADMLDIDQVITP